LIQTHRRVSLRLAGIFLAAASFLLGAAPARPSEASAPAQAAPSNAAQDDIRAAYEQINAAMTQHDLPRALAYFAPDYTLENGSEGTLNRAQAQRLYQERMGQIKTLQCRYVVSRITPVPGGAWAEMRAHSEGTGEKRLLFARLQGRFTNELWVRDLWISTPQGWRLKCRRTLQDETHIHWG
jgi:hypothetical protein